MYFLFYLLCLSLANHPHSSFFYNGNLTIYLDNDVILSNFQMSFKSYQLSRVKEQSNKYILTSIDSMTESILNNENHDNDYFYLFGDIYTEKSENLYIKKGIIPVVGVYKVQTNQILLFHSLGMFLSEKTIKDYVQNEELTAIGYQSELFPLLFKIKRMIDEITFKDPTSEYLIFEKKNFVKNLQKAAFKVHSHVRSYYPLIYFRIKMNEINHTYIQGYLATSKNNLIEIYANQIGFISNTNFFKKYLIIFNLIIYICIYYYSRYIFTFTSYYEYLLSLFYDFLIIYNSKNDLITFHIFPHLIFILKFSKMIEIFYLTKYLVYKYSLYLSSFFGYAILTLVVLYNFPFGSDAYSILSMILCFSNLIPRILYFSVNDNERHLCWNKKNSWFMIFLTLIRRIEMSYLFLFSQHELCLSENEKFTMSLTFKFILIQCLILLFLHYKNLFFSKIDDNHVCEHINEQEYDYFMKKPQPHTDCTICFSEILPDVQTIMVTPCNHAFHEFCLRRWMRERNVCPFCVTALPPFHYKEKFS